VRFSVCVCERENDCVCVSMCVYDGVLERVLCVDDEMCFGIYTHI